METEAEGARDRSAANRAALAAEADRADRLDAAAAAAAARVGKREETIFLHMIFDSSGA